MPAEFLMPRLFAILPSLLLCALPANSAEPPSDQANEFFEKKIRPLLVENCFECHSAKLKEPKAGLRLDSRAAMLKGTEIGPAIIPGHPEKSRLILAVSYKDTELRMPKKGKLPVSAIADLTKWIKMGAPWPGSPAVAEAPTKPGFDLAKRKAEHWAWQPVKLPPVPDVQNRDWPLSPVDRFILSKLEQQNLRPAPPADLRTWLRRVHFDITGLPPTPSEIDAFMQSSITNPQSAMAAVVDRLLASPRYGERWGRHWLDLVRYAETYGHEFDPIIPNAYQYRDYVIRTLNADAPYDQFVREHIAGDLIKPRLNADGGFNESILGTGFWFFGEQVHSPVDIRGDEADRIDNKIDVFGKTFLGLTISCARCHDHKFDAISQKDYYALSGFILSSSYRQVRFDSIENNKRVAKELEELRAKYRPAVLKVFADTIEPSLERIAPSLLAACDAMRASKAGDTDEVRAWVKHLTAAAKDPNDPFYLWAIACATDKASLLERFKKLKEERGKEDEKWLSSFGQEHLIATSNFDWSSGPWSADQIGKIGEELTEQQLEWGSSIDRPILRFNYWPAVRFDSVWNSNAVIKGTETDHGVLGNVARYGRAIRTRNTTLLTGKVYLLVKGKGRCYAAVDSHTMIAGPLHGRLVLDFDTGGKRKWVLHDLTPYVGHRCHFELSPSGEGEFAVEAAIEAESAPMLEPGFKRWAQINEPDCSKPEEFAQWYARQLSYFVRTMKEYEGGRLRDQLGDIWGNFVLAHPELFGVNDFAKVSEAAKPYFEEYAKLIKSVRRDSRLAPAISDVSAVNACIHIRGSHKALGEQVSRRFLEALVGSKEIDEDSAKEAFLTWTPQASGRDKLADQVTNPAINPFVARVIVNRVWHHLLGRGVVASVDNFGVMGERPTHPELLDYLADRFVRDGWSIKRLIRELVLSQTYRMSSQGDAESDQADAQNLFLHKARLRRLEGEAIRDAMLAVSGRLDEKMYGPSVPIHLTEFIDGRGKGESGPIDGNGRRSVYLAVKRNFLSPFLLAFDTPTPFSTMGRRTVSNVPAQALILMNDPFVHQQAERWAKNVLAKPGNDRDRIRQMYASAFARAPSAEEEEKMLVYVSRSREKSGDLPAWKDLAHVLFNVKEFIYLP